MREEENLLSATLGLRLLRRRLRWPRARYSWCLEVCGNAWGRTDFKGICSSEQALAQGAVGSLMAETWWVLQECREGLKLGCSKEMLWVE